VERRHDVPASQSADLAPGSAGRGASDNSPRSSHSHARNRGPVRHKSGRGKGSYSRGDVATANAVTDMHQQMRADDVVIRDLSVENKELRSENEDLRVAVEAAQGPGGNPGGGGGPGGPGRGGRGGDDGAGAPHPDAPDEEQLRRARIAEARRTIEGIDFTIEDDGIALSSKLVAGSLGYAAGAFGARATSAAEPGFGGVLGAILSVGAVAYLGGGRRYRFRRWIHHPHEDRRPDSASQLEMKHEEPLYAEIEILQGDRVRAACDEAVYRSGLMARPVLRVSLEIVAQLSTSRNMNLNATDFVTWERINAAARSLQTVNFDRYLSLQNVNVVQESSILVYALYKKMKEATDVAGPFPRADL